MKRSRSWRTKITGLSLLETLVALFLLLGAFTVLALMYQQSFHYLRRADKQARANLLADNLLAEIREWAAVPANFQQATWAAWANVTRPEFPEFKASLTKSLLPQLSPCTSLELPWPVAERVVMHSTLALVTLEVSEGGQSVSTVVSTIAEPERRLRGADPVEVTPVGPVPSPLPVDAEVEWTATLFDNAGQPIDDVNFTWTVQAGTGNATLRPARDQRSATLKNVYVSRSGVAHYKGGNCRVSAVATYHGLEVEGLSGVIGLSP
jgi:hypothetical protein